MTFTDLLDRLLTLVRLRLRNGELTERGLARKVGLSQPHVHNVISGFRMLTTPTADRILDGLGLTVVDLLDPGMGATSTRTLRRTAEQRAPGRRCSRSFGAQEGDVPPEPLV